MIASIMCLLLYYGLCLAALACDGGFRRLKTGLRNLSPVHWSLLGLAVAGFLAFIHYWPRQDRYVYFWDYAYYWNACIKRVRFIGENSLSEVMKTLYQSINDKSYNLFLPTLLALPLKAYGYTFPRYVDTCCVLFLLPALLVQGMTVMKLAGEGKVVRGGLYVAAVILAMLLPNNYYAVFHGYLDVGFLLPVSCACYLLVDYDFRRVSPSKNVIVALLLALIWICRRYTVFLIIGYVAALAVKAMVVLIQDRGWKALRSIILNFLMIGVVSLGLLFLCFREFVLRALLNNYSESYSAYSGSMSGKIRGLCGAFGIVTVALALVSAVLCLVRRRGRVNCLALLVMGLAIPPLFWRIQDMGIQHNMLMNVPVYMLCAMVLIHWDTAGEPRQDRTGRRGRKAVVATCVAVMVVNFAVAFVPALPTSGILLAERYVPYRRDDIDALNTLADKLNALSPDEGQQDIYVCASGVVLNDDILQKLHMPDVEKYVPAVYPSCGVDLRDGFPYAFLASRYVVTTDPVQTHLPKGQEVVRYPAAMIQDPDSCIGRHYRLIDEVALGEGVTAKIYQKTSNYSRIELREIQQHFEGIYPDYPELFTNRIRR